ncbi:MAG: pseudaminic acid cytidylyltransferase [Planctomycetota bacterium]|nr:MAG: pseudaminic acid cytidylyltransferase [Planctomycetota bacterium]
MPKGLLAIIPARGGSKRIPEKNIREFCGQPLIAYTILAAFESKIFNNVIVSTDSSKIKEIAEAFGAEVPFLRSSDISDDHTPVSAATVDALERIDPQGVEYSHVCQLMANCPLRTSEDIINSYQQFTATGADAQISVNRYGWQNPWWAYEREDEFILKSLHEDMQKMRSQDLPELFCPTGAIWWAKAEALRKHKTFHIPGKSGWEMPWQRAIDIDTDDDWKLAELLFKLSGEHDINKH